MHYFCLENKGVIIKNKWLPKWNACPPTWRDVRTCLREMSDNFVGESKNGLQTIYNILPFSITNLLSKNTVGFNKITSSWILHLLLFPNPPKAICTEPSIFSS